MTITNDLAPVVRGIARAIEVECAGRVLEWEDIFEIVWRTMDGPTYGGAERRMVRATMEVERLLPAHMTERGITS